MILYFHDESGKVYGKRSGSAKGLSLLLDDPQVLCVESEYDHAINEVFVNIDSGELVILGSPPSDAHLIDLNAKAWVWDIDRAKLSVWEQIKSNRDVEEFGTFVWNGYTFDCNEVSQRRIQGAVQLAQLDSAMSIDWTLSDNSAITLSAAEVIAVGQTLAVHVNACHVKARGLRGQINAAQTEAELSVITW